MTYRKRQEDLSLKWLQQLGLGQAEASSQELPQALGLRNSGIPAIFPCLSWCIGEELDWKQSSTVLWDAGIAGGCLMSYTIVCWPLNLMRTSSPPPSINVVSSWEYVNPDFRLCIPTMYLCTTGSVCSLWHSSLQLRSGRCSHRTAPVLLMAFSSCDNTRTLPSVHAEAYSVAQWVSCYLDCQCLM